MSLPTELAYFFLSLTLAIYARWRYSRNRNRTLFLFALSLVFLSLSTAFRSIIEIAWTYEIYPLLTVQTYVDLGALAFFACFAIVTVIGIKEMVTMQARSIPEIA